MSLWCTKLSRTTLLEKKTQKPTTQKKRIPLQWQQNFKQKNRKTICSWSFTCSGDTLPFRVVGCHVALRMHTALATITHVHETGFNKFMFNSQEWIVIGGCCISPNLRICKYRANPFEKPLLNAASQQSEKFQTSNSLCLSYSRLDAYTSVSYFQSHTPTFYYKQGLFFSNIPSWCTCIFRDLDSYY